MLILLLSSFVVIIYAASIASSTTASIASSTTAVINSTGVTEYTRYNSNTTYTQANITHINYPDNKPKNNNVINDYPTKNSTHDTPKLHHEKEIRYKVAKIDFNRVAAPLIVTAWILLASIAKIG